MKYVAGVLFCIGMLNPLLGRAQTVNFEDGFEDGDFATAPAWSGSNSKFGVITRSSNHLLQLQDTTGDTAWLSTPSTNTVGYWEFYVELDFSPSGGNNATIFLMSDIANLTGPVNGYALQVGESG